MEIADLAHVPRSRIRWRRGGGRQRLLCARDQHALHRARLGDLPRPRYLNDVPARLSTQEARPHRDFEDCRA